MPTITKIGSSYRAQVMVNRVRHSATFKTLEHAEEWAGAMKRGAPGHAGPVLTAAQVLSLPRESGVCGVYFLFKGDQLLYVGQSTNVYRRVARHSKIYQHDSYAIIRCSRQNLSVLEAYYIDLMNPPLNRRKMWFRRAGDWRTNTLSAIQRRAGIVPRSVPRKVNVGAEGVATSSDSQAPP